MMEISSQIDIANGITIGFTVGAMLMIVDGFRGLMRGDGQRFEFNQIINKCITNMKDWVKIEIKLPHEKEPIPKEMTLFRLWQNMYYQIDLFMQYNSSNIKPKDKMVIIQEIFTPMRIANQLKQDIMPYPATHYQEHLRNMEKKIQWLKLSDLAFLEDKD
ncbi:MAG: hypothetical protein OXF49_02300 [Candidatus Saccharibacteria bacterium]|nr:hypothetical protein [Candidatus Saccharibacteria bacterium]